MGNRITNLPYTVTLISLSETVHTLSAAYLGFAFSEFLSDSRSASNITILSLPTLAVAIFLITFGVKLYENGEQVEEVPQEQEERSRDTLVSIFIFVILGIIFLLLIKSDI